MSTSTTEIDMSNESKPTIRITFNVVVEYEADPQNYPDGYTPEQMLAVDLANAEEDPFLLVEGGEWTTTAEIVK